MSISKRRLKEIASLRQKKYRERLGQYVVEGVRSVESAVDAQVEMHDVIVARDALPEETLQRLRSRASAETHVIDQAAFDRLSNVQTSQGVLAVASVSSASRSDVYSSRRILALDAVQDPGNAGTLIRTAAWFGIESVVAGAGTVDLFNPKTVRAAMGGLFDVRVRENEDLPEFLSEARSQGFIAYGAEMDGRDADHWEPSERSILVLGNEGSGISGETHRALDSRLTIRGGEQGRGVESLNVAQAATVLMYLWTRPASDSDRG